VEEMLMTLELSLSRAEVKRLAARVGGPNRDQLNYRTLTDVEDGHQVTEVRHIS
jgi:hypothetical protein